MPNTSIAPAENLHSLPASVTTAQATAVDPLASVHHGFALMPPRDSDTVAVFGLGPMGLYAIQLARLSGVKRVIAAGRKPGPLSWARACGADDVIDMHRQELGPELQRLTGGRGPSYVVEATGAPNMLDEALRQTGRGGRVLLLGVFHAAAQFTPAPIVRGELQLMGSLCYTASEYQYCLELLATRRIQPIGYRVFGLSEMQHAIDAFRARDIAKAILTPD